MAGIIRHVVRFGVIGTAIGAGVVVIAGPERVMAMVTQTRSTVNKAIDRKIEDPVALRQQLRHLEAQYPERIASVRGDLAEVSEQIAYLERQGAESRIAAELAQADLGQIKQVIARAEDARTSGAYQVVKVRLDQRSMSLDDAYARANRLNQMREAFVHKSADFERDLGYLAQQRERLAGLLETLEAERAQFQSQLFALSHQVDAIARNERLIELLDRRQQSIEEHSRYRAASLDQVQSRFAEIRARQEAKLEMFGQSSEIKNYEKAARYRLENERARRDWTRPPAGREVEIAPSVIEIGPEDLDGAVGPAPLSTPGRMATR